MIKMQLSARHYKLDNKLQKYCEEKLGTLDHYFGEKSKPIGLQIEIQQDQSGKENNKFHVRAIIKIAGPDLIAEAAAATPESAIDLVETKLKHQISRLKRKRLPQRMGIKQWFSRNSRNSE